METPTKRGIRPCVLYLLSECKRDIWLITAYKDMSRCGTCSDKESQYELKLIYCFLVCSACLSCAYFVYLLGLATVSPKFILGEIKFHCTVS